VCSVETSSENKITKRKLPEDQSYPTLTKAQKSNIIPLNPPLTLSKAYQGYCDGYFNPFTASTPIKIRIVDENDDEALCDVRTAYSGMTPPTFDPK